MTTVKEHILNEVNCMIHEKGFKGITFLSLAERISTSRENVHHHFKTKEKLGVAYLDYLKLSLENDFFEIHHLPANTFVKLEAYYDLYQIAKKGRAICPIVPLLNEYRTLPSSMKKGIDELINIEFKNLKKILNEDYRLDDNEIQSIIMLLKGTVLYEKTNISYFNKTLISIKKFLDIILPQEK